MKILLSILLVLVFSITGVTKEYSLENMNVKDGLPNSNINCILQDNQGFLWIGTSGGLYRYDGYAFELLALKDNKRGNNRITCLKLNSDNQLWISTFGGGIFCYDIKLEKFIELNIKNPVENYLIKTLEFQDDSVLWVGTQIGLIKYSITDTRSDNTKSLSYELLMPDPYISNRNNNYITCLKLHIDGSSLWVGTNSRLFLLDTKTSEFRKINTGIKRAVRTINKISENNLIIGFWDSGVCMIDNSGNIKSTPETQFLEKTVGNYRVISLLKENEKSYWIGTRENGIYHFSFSNDLFQRKNFRFNPANVESIGSNSASCLLKDRSNIIWAGQLNSGGLTKITSDRYRLNYIKETENINVNSILARSPHKIWLGTQGQGMMYLDLLSKTCKEFKKSTGKHLNIDSDLVLDIFEDSDGNFWIGTHGHGIKIIPRKQIIEIEANQKIDKLNYITIKRSQFPVFNDYVSDLCEDQNGTIWAGTNQGLYSIRHLKQNSGPDSSNLTDISQITIINFFKNDRFLKKLAVSSLYRDSKGNLWVSTQNKGLIRIDLENPDPEKAMIFESNTTSAQSLQSNQVFGCRQDDQNNLWVTSSKGLDIIDLSDYRIKQVLTNNDISNNGVHDLVFDHNGRCWLGMSYGIFCLDTLKNDIKKYYRASSYGNFYNLNSIFQSEEGTFYFGSKNGVTYFNPDSISNPRMDIPVYISSFKINNVKVKPGDKINGRVVLTENINETSAITLKSDDNHISFEIASLDFLDRSSIQYKYLLEGAVPEWTTLNRGQHTISYTNLRKGNYTLHIKASNSEGVWSDEEIRLNIKVLPPIWQSNVAIAAYSFLILVLLYLFWSYSIIREKEKNKLKLIHVEKEKSEELNNLKLQFFTNISHEFKTPLSLIISPLEVILSKDKDPETRQQLNIIQRNANRLLFLINQILDIRKLEAGKIKLSCIPVNLSDFSSEIFLLFQSLAGKKQIDIFIQKANEEISVNIDRHYIESVLYNVISNAFRFTSSNDKIEIKVFKTEKFGCISVSDTGKGIPKDQLPKIFERFYHTPKQDTQWGGAGIGLSFSKSIVVLHNGVIEVESEEGKGSTFTIKLPLHEPRVISETKVADHISSPDINQGLNYVIKHQRELYAYTTLKNDGNRKELSVLVVEDNSDLNEFISNQLKAKYNVFSAKNGKIGWEIIQSEKPDLVVTDLMMPEMDGMELCGLIKNSEDYSHIPVIMLTAKNLEEDRVNGYRTGADAYIFKPFKFQFLLLRIENLLAFKANVKNQTSNNLYTPSDKKIESKDKIFIDKIIALIEENLNNSEFNVDKIYKSLGVSRTNLYRKIKELTGYSVKEFVREIRLQNAAHILREDDITVNEVAYSVGFESISYFSKCFRKKFNMSPSKYKNEHYTTPVIEL